MASEKPTPEQLAKWTAKYGRKPKPKEIAWEMAQAKQRMDPAEQTRVQAAGDAWLAAVQEMAAKANKERPRAQEPSREEQEAFERRRSQAEDEQRAAFRRANYEKAETPEEAHRAAHARDFEDEDH